MKLRLVNSALIGSLLTVGMITIGTSPTYAVPAYNQDNLCETIDCTNEMRRLSRLARHGSGDAAAIVATAYASGEGLEQSNRHAERYIRMGVRYESALASYVLSTWHRNGFIVEQDLDESARLLDLAIRYDHTPAMYQKAILLLQGETTAVNKTDDPVGEAIQLLQKAADKKLNTAMFLLARLKHTGAGVPQDKVTAATLYSELTMAGYNDARPFLYELRNEFVTTGAHPELVSSMDDAASMERIQIIGNRQEINNRLDTIARRLESTGDYDNRTIMRIRGVRCEDTGMNCSSVRPERGSSSLNETLTGQQGN